MHNMDDDDGDDDDDDDDDGVNENDYGNEEVEDESQKSTPLVPNLSSFINCFFSAN